MDTDTDAKLMLRVKAGEQAAFKELVEHWQGPLLNYFYRSLPCRATAEDLTQETFIRIYRAASRYKPKAKFSTYLFHVARSALLTELRRQARKPVTAVSPEQLPAVAGEATSRNTELEEVFQMALATLPEKQRTALLLRKQQELSYEAIAKTMGLSLASVKTTIHRARVALKAQMQQLMQSP
jgi:RNA polymerase sigma-70 factor (ECF subfamily)